VEFDTTRILTLLQNHDVRKVQEASTLQERNLWWSNRKTAFGAMGLISPRYYVQDGVIPRSALPEALDNIAEIADRYQILIANVFHAGDGNLHPLLLYDDRDSNQVIRVRRAGSEILAYCVAAGGSITGEHGIGIEKLDEMRLQFTAKELELHQMLKHTIDPYGLLNPGKVLPQPGRCIDYQRL